MRGNTTKQRQKRKGMDEKTVNDLYQMGVIDDRHVRRINIINSLNAGVRPSAIARRFGICRQQVYKIKSSLLKKDPPGPTLPADE